MSETSSHDPPAGEGGEDAPADGSRAASPSEPLWPDMSPDLQVLVNSEMDISLEEALDALKLHGSAYQVIYRSVLKKLTGEATAPSGENAASPHVIQIKSPSSDGGLDTSPRVDKCR